MATQDYTVRSNRQRPRIWIEGARLSNAGFTHHTPYTIDFADDFIIIKRCAERCAEGARKVSGAPTRPIIDLTGKSCGPFETGDAVTIIYTDGVILSSAEVKS